MPQALQKPLLERLFELARTARFSRNRHLADMLKREGYSATEIQAHFQGKGLRNQIKAIRRNEQRCD